MTKKIKEQIETEEVEVGRDIQQFMNDMRTVGNQVRDKNLVKPAFHYGDLGVTNYLLWLILGEMADLNNKLEEEG